MTLKDLEIGRTAVITAVGGDGALRQHFLDMGVIPGTEVTIKKYAPMGDPMELMIHGYELTMRLADAEQIMVEPVTKRKEVPALELPPEDSLQKTVHPGLGEGGRFHPKGSGNPLPEGTLLTFALVGNQNSGKTTLFNQLTGSNQHVGNFPGVTVSRKDGVIKGYPNTRITDLPGIYSMSPYTSEELVSRSFVLNEKPKAIINIVDAMNIERNLYLTMQILEMGIPTVIALNMMDEVASNGGTIDVNRMEELLGVPVIPISAAKNFGIEELVRHAVHIAHYQEKPLRQDFCDENDHNGAVHRCIHGIIHLIEDHAQRSGLPVRFAAAKERIRSEKIDRILTGKYTAIPVFIGIMGLMFWLTFNVIGAFLQELLESGIDALSAQADAALSAAHVNQVIHGLIIDGIFTGVGSVLSFLPIIVTLFLFLSLLEDSGYIARVAFFMDKLLRKIGLSGRSIVPLLIGFGCTVPAVMSTRTLPSERDRIMTILLTPFMSCTAKLPIYGFFVQTFFPEKSGIIMVGLYLLGITAGILAAFLYRGTLFKGEAAPFVMELPNYRLPGARNVFQLLWEKAKDFLQRAFSIILIATSFDLHFNPVQDSGSSMLALLAGCIAPVLQPLGLGDWRIATSLITGFIAKESVVSTMEILFGSNVSAFLVPAAAASMLVFSLLYTPCVAAIASVRRELGTKYAAGMVIWQCAVAWVAALIVKAVFTFWGGV